MKNMGDYHNSYLKTYILLKHMYVFEQLRKNVPKVLQITSMPLFQLSSVKLGSNG